MLKQLYQGVFIARTVTNWLKSRELRAQNEGRFLDTREEKRLLSGKHEGLLLDGQKARLSVENSFRNLAVIATTGAGKTASFIVPNLLTLDRCSMVVTDPSGSLYDRTAADLVRRGFKVHRLEPKDLTGSIRYNPLARAETTAAQQEIAHVLISTANRGGKPVDPFWSNSAEEILGILIKCLKTHVEADKYANLANLAHLLNSMGDGNALMPFVAANAPDNRVYDGYKSFVEDQSEKTRQGIVAQAKAALTMMADPELAALTASSTFDFESFRREKTVLFLVIPQNRIGYYSGLMSLFYTDLMHFLLDDEIFARLGKGALPVYLLMDEFGHMTIPDFPAVITTTRQRKVSISIILQSMSQLEERYGEQGAQTILDGGIGSRLFFSGMDIGTAEMLSRTIGDIRTSYLDAFGRPQIDREPVMSPAAIRAMPDEKVLYLFANKRPTLLDVVPYFKRGELERRTRQVPKIARKLGNVAVPPVAVTTLF